LEIDMQLAKNFSRSEMLVSNTATRLGLSNEPATPEIEANLLRSAKYLQTIRDKLGKPIRVLSCYRSPAVNKAVGGSATSAHMRALAIDMVAQDIDNRDLAEFIRDNFEYDQIILEFYDKKTNGGWVHVGTPSPHHTRNEVLTAVKVYGKTVYKQGLV
jgi:hypothetical protein